MSYEAQKSIRQGEIEPVYGQISAQAGDTVTIQPAPQSPYSAPSFTLLGSSGAAVTGFAGLAISAGNYTPSAAATVLLWFVLDTTSLTSGAYVARLSAAVTSTADGITRQKICEVQITVLSSVEIVATYDPNTPIGKTRLYCLDNDPAAVVFGDDEITQFLADSNQSPMLAASLALELLCMDNLRLSNAIRIGAYKNTSGSVYSALVERAARMRAIAPVRPVVVSSPAVFTRGDPDAGTIGSLDVW